MYRTTNFEKERRLAMTTAKLEMPGRKKAQRSKLDPYLGQLQEMERQNKGVSEMVAWLKTQGFDAKRSTVSDFLAKQRDRQREESWLRLIYSGAQQCKEVEATFAENPAPAVETLIKMHRVLIMKLMTKEKKKGEPDMERIKLSNQLTKTVLGCMAARTRTELKERELDLAEAKAVDARSAEQEKALQWCLDEVQAFPEVAALFKAAFDALKEKVAPVPNEGGNKL
jgi:hypothetical protein